MELSFNVAFGLYIASLVIYGINLFFKKKKINKLSFIVLTIGLLYHSLSIVSRWSEAGRPPFSTMYESMSFFAWSIVFIYFIARFIYKVKYLGFYIVLLAVMVMGYTSILDDTIKPLLPALQSNWLSIHVITCFIGYAAFSISFITSLIYLIVNVKKRVESLDKRFQDNLDKISYKMISLGFLFLTLGIITGSVWANKAWGTYWGWDPKETWSLITWFIYAIYLHLRHIKSYKGIATAWVSVIGFIAVIFTYLGVNYLLAGLHSYA